MIIDKTYPNNIIKLGQNRHENDLIVKQAKQNDLWFHLDKLPSCHLTMVYHKKYSFTREKLKYCANLVKNNTKYKHHSKITVLYTSISNVRRTITPGLVRIKSTNKCKKLII